MVLVLPCVPGLLHRIVEMTGADQVLQVFDTVTDAATTLSSWRHRLRTVAPADRAPPAAIARTAGRLSHAYGARKH
ncbi:hypothetical protein [Streptomyces sp. NPDC001536]|uniref:hypothetical protein n=1 Tax=Streptomyces sp. NPDC001536 TaxID=3364583 RepID=UPI0036C8E84F